MPSSSNTINPSIPPILHLVSTPLEEQKQALITQAQSLMAELPIIYRRELNIPLFNLQWSGQDQTSIQEKISILSSKIKEIQEKISPTEEPEDPKKSEMLKAVYIKIQNRKKEVELLALEKLKKEAEMLITQARDLRDSDVLTSKSELLLLKSRIELEETLSNHEEALELNLEEDLELNLEAMLESNHNNLLKEKMNQLSGILKDLSPALIADSPEPKRKKRNS